MEEDPLFDSFEILLFKIAAVIAVIAIVWTIWLIE